MSTATSLVGRPIQNATPSSSLLAPQLSIQIPASTPSDSSCPPFTLRPQPLFTPVRVLLHAYNAYCHRVFSRWEKDRENFFYSISKSANVDPLDAQRVWTDLTNLAQAFSRKCSQVVGSGTLTVSPELWATWTPGILEPTDSSSMDETRLE